MTDECIGSEVQDDMILPLVSDEAKVPYRLTILLVPVVSP